MQIKFFIKVVFVTNQSTVYSRQSADALVIDIYHVRKKFPKDELYYLTTKIKKSSRPFVQILNNMIQNSEKYE